MLKTLAAKHRGRDKHCSIDFNLSNSAIFVKVFKGKKLMGVGEESPQDDSFMTMWVGEIKELRNGHYFI